MNSYPFVLSESDTLDRVLTGVSLARYGDGEFKIAGTSSDIKSQPYHAELSKRLRNILIDSGACMVGIPNIHSETPKAEFWGKPNNGPESRMCGPCRDRICSKDAVGQFICIPIEQHNKQQQPEGGHQ